MLLQEEVEEQDSDKITPYKSELVYLDDNFQVLAHTCIPQRSRSWYVATHTYFYLMQHCNLLIPVYSTNACCVCLSAVGGSEIKSEDHGLQD